MTARAFQKELLINRAFEIILSGKTTLSSPNSAGSSTNKSITHNLGYQPLVLAFVAFSPTGTRHILDYLSPHLTGGGVSNGLIDFQVSLEVVDANTITFFHRDIASPSNLTDYIYWYILKEKVNTT